jgi:putative transposase
MLRNQMPRKLLIKTDLYPYHIVTRSRNRDWYDLPMSLVWRIYCESFKHSLFKHPARIHAFVLMNNHYHLLISTLGENINKFMFEFNRMVSLKMRVESKRINQIFGGRYNWSLITEQKYLYNVYRYIYRNPIKANMGSKCEHYLYSTLNPTACYPFKLDNIIDVESKEFMVWINKVLEEDEEKIIQCGLKKTYFKPLIDSKTRNPFELEQF